MNVEKYLNETNPVATMSIRGHGQIEVQLFYEVAPNTVLNFIDLVEKSFYDGLIFHRVIPGFMIQGGQGKKALKQIKGEFLQNRFDNPLIHTRGVISMARTNIKDSATSQFFIMHHDSPHLDGGYAGFGCVVSGIEVVDQIANVQTDRNDNPKNPVIIEKVTIDLKGKTYSKPVFVDWY